MCGVIILSLNYHWLAMSSCGLTAFSHTVFHSDFQEQESVVFR